MPLNDSLVMVASAIPMLGRCSDDNNVATDSDCDHCILQRIRLTEPGYSLRKSKTVSSTHPVTD